MAYCVFCRIAAGQQPARVVAQDERVIAIEDANPQAPVHVLVIPRQHVAGLREAEDEALLGHLVATANLVAAARGVAEGGYRLVVNVGRNGGQQVKHLHLHVLGGRPMTWPPG